LCYKYIPRTALRKRDAKSLLQPRLIAIRKRFEELDLPLLATHFQSERFPNNLCATRSSTISSRNDFSAFDAGDSNGVQVARDRAELFFNQRHPRRNARGECICVICSKFKGVGASCVSLGFHFFSVNAKERKRSPFFSSSEKTAEKMRDASAAVSSFERVYCNGGKSRKLMSYPL
jgi:hypothetical protein